MKKLALAIGLGAYIVFGASGGTLAAERADNTAGTAAIRDNRIDWKATGTNVRLLFVDEQLYPDTTVGDTDTTFYSVGTCFPR